MNNTTVNWYIGTAAAFVIACLIFLSIGPMQAYRSGYSAAYSESNVDQGEIEKSRLQGQQMAVADRKQGSAFYFYRTTFLVCGFSGVTLGILLQFSWLAFANTNGKKISEFDVIMIPGAGRSEAYRQFSSRKIIQAEHEQELSKLELERKLKLRTIDAAYEKQRRQLLAADSLDELAAVKTVDIFNNEVDAMVAKIQRQQDKRSMRCGWCGKKIVFPSRRSGETVACPNKQCNKAIKLQE